MEPTAAGERPPPSPLPPSNPPRLEVLKALLLLLARTPTPTPWWGQSDKYFPGGTRRAGKDGAAHAFISQSSAQASHILAPTLAPTLRFQPGEPPSADGTEPSHHAESQ